MHSKTDIHAEINNNNNNNNNSFFPQFACVRLPFEIIMAKINAIVICFIKI